MATFEELAEQLAQGPSPEQRIAAAETLADVDDPRVAPALARALADPSAAVRERVEALLGHFCRRDRSGQLEALLEEAERVSTALAAEVVRLRGGAPPQAEPAPLEPIEPPDGFEGDCVVVRLDTRPMDLKRMCRIVAEATEQALFAVTREVYLTKGILARPVPADVARQLVRRLGQAGVPAAAAPADWLPEPLDVVRLRDPQFDLGGLCGTVVPEGEECRLAWDAVELVVAGRIEVELKRGGAQEEWSPLGRPLFSRERLEPLHEVGYEYVLEVYAGEPLRRLRLLTHELDFEIMQRRPQDFGSVARLARGILPHVDSDRVGLGVRRMAERDRDIWDDLTFISPVAFEQYVAWHRLLLVLGVPLPRDRY